jgi:hypothetical protein
MVAIAKKAREDKGFGLVPGDGYIPTTISVVPGVLGV